MESVFKSVRKEGFVEVYCAQKTPFWLALRQCFLTASNFGTVLGINKYMSQDEFVRNLHLDEEEKQKQKGKQNTYAMDWGNLHEKDGVYEYQMRLPEGTSITFPGIVIDLDLKLAASPDGYVGEDGAIEIKCPVNRCFYKEIPPSHIAQMVGIMGICRRKWIDHVQWTPNGIKVTRFEHNEGDWEHMKGILNDFYDNYKDTFRSKYDAFWANIGDYQ